MAYDAAVESLNEPSLNTNLRTKKESVGTPLLFASWYKVLGSVPGEWKKEDRYQKMGKML
jgi:hypothetical protein